MFHTHSRRADNQTPHRSVGIYRIRLAVIKYTEFASLTHPKCTGQIIAVWLFFRRIKDCPGCVPKTIRNPLPHLAIPGVVSSSKSGPGALILASAGKMVGLVAIGVAIFPGSLTNFAKRGLFGQAVWAFSAVNAGEDPD